jgi:hypothetical protein
VDQKILEFGHIRLLAADSDFRASFVLCGLFTLITKHDLPPFGHFGILAFVAAQLPAQLPQILLFPFI